MTDREILKKYIILNELVSKQRGKDKGNGYVIQV